MYKRPLSSLECSLPFFVICFFSGTYVIAGYNSDEWTPFVNGYPGASNVSEPAVGYDGNASSVARDSTPEFRMPEESSTLLLSTESDRLAGSEQPNSSLAEPNSTTKDAIFSETDSTTKTAWWSDTPPLSSANHAFSMVDDEWLPNEWLPNEWPQLANRENEDFLSFSDRDAYSSPTDTMVSDDDNGGSTGIGSISTIDWLDISSSRSSLAGMASGRTGSPTATGSSSGGGGPSAACTELISAVFRDSCVDAFDPLRVKVSANRYLSTAYQTLTGPSAARLLGATTAVFAAAGGGRQASLSAADELACSLARHWAGSRYGDCASGSQGVLAAVGRLRPDCLPGDGAAQLRALFDGLDRMASVLNDVCTGLLPSKDPTACDLVAEVTCQSEAASASNISSQIYGIGLVCDGALRLQTFADCLRQRTSLNCTTEQARLAKTLEEVAGAYNFSMGVTLADMASSCVALQNQCDSGTIVMYSQQCLAGVADYIFAPPFTVTLGSGTSINWKVATEYVCQNLSSSLNCLNAKVLSGAMSCQPLLDIAQKATTTYRVLCNELLQDDTNAMKDVILHSNVPNVSYAMTAKNDIIVQTASATPVILSDAKSVTSATKILTGRATSIAAPSPAVTTEDFTGSQILTAIIASSLSTSVQPEATQGMTTTTVSVDAPSTQELQDAATTASTVVASSRTAPTQGPWGPADKLGRGSVLEASALALVISLSFSGGFVAVEAMLFL